MELLSELYSAWNISSSCRHMLKERTGDNLNASFLQQMLIPFPCRLNDSKCAICPKRWIGVHTQTQGSLGPCDITSVCARRSEEWVQSARPAHTLPSPSASGARQFNDSVIWWSSNNRGKSGSSCAHSQEYSSWLQDEDTNGNCIENSLNVSHLSCAALLLKYCGFLLFSHAEWKKITDNNKNKKASVNPHS